MKIYETCVQTFVLCVAMLFFSNSPATVGPAILSFIASTDYVDCLRLAISLGATLTRWPPSQDLWPMPTIRKCPTHWCIRP